MVELSIIVRYNDSFDCSYQWQYIEVNGGKLLETVCLYGV